MKFAEKFLILVLVSCIGFLFFVSYNTSDKQVVKSVASHQCSCRPVEHWLYKSCVKKYNKMYDAQLEENYDTEGLSFPVLQAIQMLADGIDFIDEQGVLIVPERNKKGKLFLPMSRHKDYVICKEILHATDEHAALSTDEFYQDWFKQLQSKKS